jgi:hypothetical protein
VAIRKVDKGEWVAFCARVTRGLLGKRAEIEVASLDLGAQVEAEWLPFLGIAYDEKSNVIEIVLEGHDHLMHDPLELYVDEDSIGMRSIHVIDSHGVKQIVRLRDPLSLPPPFPGLSTPHRPVNGAACGTSEYENP